MKILHITTNNIFISHAMQTFESVYPSQNTVWMLEEEEDISTKKKSYPKFYFEQTLNPLFYTKLKEFDLVVLHSLHWPWFLLIALAPQSIKFAWLGWGYDYYNYIYASSDKMLLKDTKVLEIECRKKNKYHIKNICLKKIKSVFFKQISNHLIKYFALKKLGSFSPVLEQDFILINKSKMIPYLPPYVPWNYGSLEENLVKSAVGQRVNNNYILLGNSASFTNNHIEIFSLLKRISILNNIKRKVIVPLSYGDELYKREILSIGEAALKKNFQPLTTFLEREQYINTIMQCGFVIMNHIRQQGMGNIIIMIYLGARVFLREENPAYHFFKLEGFVLNTVQELECHPELLRENLTEKQILNNIKLLYKHWSKVAIDNKTRALINFHLLVE